MTDHLPNVVVLSQDLFFGMRIRNALKQMGYTTLLENSEDAVAERLRSASAALALIDFNNPVAWEKIGAIVAEHPDLAILAFGPHTDVGAFRSAKEAGITRTISNGAFSEQLPDLIDRYAASH